VTGGFRRPQLFSRRLSAAGHSCFTASGGIRDDRPARGFLLAAGPAGSIPAGSDRPARNGAADAVGRCIY